MTVGVVSSAAYALFSSTVTVSGLTISSGNADLVIYDGGTTLPIQDFINGLNGTQKLKNIYPGWHDYTVMDFVNNSASSIEMNLKGQITSYSNDWDDLKSVIQIAVSDSGTYNNPPDTGWYTLNQWNSTARSIGTTLGVGETKPYKFFMKVPSTADNSISGKTVNLNFEFTGTQTP